MEIFVLVTVWWALFGPWLGVVKGEEGWETGSRAFIEVILYQRNHYGEYEKLNTSTLEGNYTPTGVVEQIQGSLKQVRFNLELKVIR